MKSSPKMKDSYNVHIAFLIEGNNKAEVYDTYELLYQDTRKCSENYKLSTVYKVVDKKGKVPKGFAPWYRDLSQVMSIAVPGLASF